MNKMKTKEQFFKEYKETEEAERKTRVEKWTQEIMEEIKEWNSDRLEDEYIKCRLSRISYGGSISSGTIWSWSKEECRFCDLEYVGAHDSCCDDCWDKNKGKTLEELDND